MHYPIVSVITEAGRVLVFADIVTSHEASSTRLTSQQVGQRCGLPLLSPVDDAGRFTDEAGAEFAGLAVLAEGNQAVIDKLSEVGALLKVSFKWTPFLTNRGSQDR